MLSEEQEQSRERCTETLQSHRNSNRQELSPTPQGGCMLPVEVDMATQARLPALLSSSSSPTPSSLSSHLPTHLFLLCLPLALSYSAQTGDCPEPHSFSYFIIFILKFVLRHHLSNN